MAKVTPAIADTIRKKLLISVATIAKNMKIVAGINLLMNLCLLEIELLFAILATIILSDVI